MSDCVNKACVNIHLTFSSISTFFFILDALLRMTMTINACGVITKNFLGKTVGWVHRYMRGFDPGSFGHRLRKKKCLVHASAWVCACVRARICVRMRERERRFHIKNLLSDYISCTLTHIINFQPLNSLKTWHQSREIQVSFFSRSCVQPPDSMLTKNKIVGRLTVI